MLISKKFLNLTPVLFMKTSFFVYCTNQLFKNKMSLPEFNNIVAAFERIRTRINKTPVLRSTALNEITGADLFLKYENFQEVGAFKFKGAVKKNAIAGYGAGITFCEPTLQVRKKTLAKVIEKTDAAFIHPYDNVNVIAGQGTAAYGLLQEIENLDYIIAPVGRGGLLSGGNIDLSNLLWNEK